MRTDRPAPHSILLVYAAIIKGVALKLLLAQILPFDVACLSTFEGCDEVPVTSHAIEIGVAEQFKPDTVYRSCSLVTFNDNICA